MLKGLPQSYPLVRGLFPTRTRPNPKTARIRLTSCGGMLRPLRFSTKSQEYSQHSSQIEALFLFHRSVGKFHRSMGKASIALRGKLG